MPPRQHGMQDSGEQRPQGQQPQNVFTRINTDIKALNTSLMLVTQKINSMVRYEKILGRNLVVLNRKLKDLQDRPQGAASGGIDSAEFADLRGAIESNTRAFSKLQSELDYIRQNYAKAEDVKEMKYVVESINPLEFVTMKDVQQMVSEAKKK
ncbi:Uncharacterised protein [uncultured archaeon]|nr:Uncharacterised protein [uncultured archaeon]